MPFLGSDADFSRQLEALKAQVREATARNDAAAARALEAEVDKLFRSRYPAADVPALEPPQFLYPAFNSAANAFIEWKYGPIGNRDPATRARFLSNGQEFPVSPNIPSNPSRRSATVANEPYKLNLFFQSGDAGWSETWYAKGATIDAVFTQTLVPLVAARGKLLGSDADIIAKRVSQESILGDSLVGNEPPASKFVPLTISDAPFTSYLVRIEAGALYRRQLYVRGIPVGVAKPVGNSGALIRSQWLAAFNLFRTFVLNNSKTDTGLCIRVHQRGTDALATAISKIAVVAGGYKLSFRFAIPVGLAVGDQVQIFNIREFPALAGRWFVTAISSLDVTIDNPNPVPFTYKGNAYGRRVGLGFQQITDLVPERIVTKHVGRPFGQPVGRRKARRRAGT